MLFYIIRLITHAMVPVYETRSTVYAVHPLQPDPLFNTSDGPRERGEGEGGRRFIDFQSGFLELNKHNVGLYG